MKRFISLRISGWRWTLALTALYCLAAAAAISFMRSDTGFSLIWPASGVAVASLLVLGLKRDRLRFLGLMAIGNAAVNLLFGLPALTAVGFAGANISEAVIAAWLAGQSGHRTVIFGEPQWALRFAAAALVGALVGALFASPFATGWTDLPFIASWMAIDMLGILIVAPFMLAALHSLHGGRRAMRARLFRFAGSLLLVTPITVGAFFQVGWPLLFLPVLGVLACTYRHGIAGATVSVALVAVLAMIATNLGLGPIRLIEGELKQVLFLQFYLFCLLGAAMPLASVLARTFRRKNALHEMNTTLELAEKIAGVGHFRIDGTLGTLTWSHEGARLCSQADRGATSVRAAIRALHREDRSAVVKQVAAARRSLAPFRFDARLVGADGSIRHIHCRGEMSIMDERTRGMVGIVHDVTERTELIRALESAHRNAETRAEEAARLAETDALTGVANRRRAFAVLEEEVARAAATGNALSVIMLDVDHFKSINDIYGHAVGDEVLCALAATGRACVRPLDLFARIGGEEFCAILPGADQAQAIEVAERLRSRIEAMPLAGLNRPRSVSVSLGVAVYCEGLDPHRILQAADTALYRAKAEGRNRFMLAA